LGRGISAHWPPRLQKPWVGSIRLQSAYFGAFDAFSCFPLRFDEFHQMALEALIYGLSSDFRVEPTVGIEPTTGGLQNRCSTAELCWRSRGTAILNEGPNSANSFQGELVPRRGLPSKTMDDDLMAFKMKV